MRKDTCKQMVDHFRDKMSAQHPNVSAAPSSLCVYWTDDPRDNVDQQGRMLASVVLLAVCAVAWPLLSVTCYYIVSNDEAGATLPELVSQVRGRGGRNKRYASMQNENAERVPKALRAPKKKSSMYF